MDVSATPAPGPDGTVFVGQHWGVFYALDGATGKQKWETPVEGRGTSSLLFKNGNVYVHVGEGCTENTIYALDAEDGSITWKYRPARVSGHLLGGVGSACAPGNRDEIYTGNANGSI